MREGNSFKAQIKYREDFLVLSKLIYIILQGKFFPNNLWALGSVSFLKVVFLFVEMYLLFDVTLRGSLANLLREIKVKLSVVLQRAIY